MNPVGLAAGLPILHRTDGGTHAVLGAHVLVVASSNLLYQPEGPANAAALLRGGGATAPRCIATIVMAVAPLLRRRGTVGLWAEIGRASCRERV